MGFTILNGGLGRADRIEDYYNQDGKFSLIEKAYQLRGLDPRALREGWKAVLEEGIWSLLEKNCATAIWKMTINAFSCEKDEDIYPLPEQVWELIAKVGEAQNIGHTMSETEIRKLQNELDSHESAPKAVVF